jgi:hypothetical protein
MSKWAGAKGELSSVKYNLANAAKIHITHERDNIPAKAEIWFSEKWKEETSDPDQVKAIRKAMEKL